MRYCILDPGTQALSCLFVAVDPENAHLWVYDGFKMAKAERSVWAHEVRRLSMGRRFQAFIIDQQAGKQHAFADTYNVAEQYWRALHDAGLEPYQVGPAELSGFYPGCNDMRAREEALRSLLVMRGPGPHVGTPALQVFRGRIPELDKQIKMACTKQGTLDKRDKTYEEGLLECLEYIAAFNPSYHPVPESPSPVSIETEAIRNFRRQRARREARRAGQHARHEFTSSIALG